MRSLSVSIVTFRPTHEVIAKTLVHLAAAARHTLGIGLVESIELDLVDNEPEGTGKSLLQLLAADHWSFGGARVQVHSGHGNIGYGRGHNLAIAGKTTDFHLVLNPDVFMEEQALAEAICFLDGHPEVGLVSPRIEDSAGNRQMLCFSYPSIFVLFLRGFAPPWMRRIFHREIDRYLMLDRDWESPVHDVPIATGCFMFCRTSLLQRIGGFSPRYFLYFEDFDLSLRLRRESRIAFLPKARITHLGGDSARKGLVHIRMFLDSAFTFFNHHGWRFFVRR